MFKMIEIILLIIVVLSLLAMPLGMFLWLFWIWGWKISLLGILSLTSSTCALFIIKVAQGEIL
jgi:hypothetical protein